MFKVECPGCKAPYQVDERRIPSSGLKMRCPKCGTSFKVDPPSDSRRTGPTPVLGGVLGVADSSPPPAIAPPEPNKGTMLGVAPQRSNPMKGTMLGVAPAGFSAPAPAPAAPIANAPSPAAAARPPVPRPGVPRPNAAAPPAPSADLPAIARGGAGGIDLPSPTAPRPAPPAAARPPAASFDLDLPSVGGSSELDLPAPRAPLPIELDVPSSGVELDLPALGGSSRPQAAVSGLPAPAPQRGGIDLPSVQRGQPHLPAVSPGAVGLPERSGVGLPARPAVPRGAGSGIELPSPRGPDLPRASTDLPDLLDMDLPLSAGELPSPIELELPSPAAGNLPARAPFGSSPGFGGNLPSLAGDLPSLGGHLPSLGGAGLPSSRGVPSVGGSPAAPATISSLPPALGGMFTPSSGASNAGLRTAAPEPPAEPILAEIELPPIDSIPPAPAFSGGFGEVDLLGGVPEASPRAAPPDMDLDSDPFGEAPLPGPMSARTAPAALAPAPRAFTPSNA
ncbi:MAG TPA: zinc-ribbon domain-containing protein, partial [Polyangiaceae bacterium]|nr:zinc-ribbon domain-containing protein [Polyangiaceae bacterium]